MSRQIDVGGWISVVLGVGLGFFTAWVSDSCGVGENKARAIAYTIIVFACAAMALRPAWGRLQLWVDLVVLFALHTALVVTVLNLLDARSIRLNWALALPFVIVELFLMLGVLWRRNVI
jgi:hypothetical protein